MLLYRRSMRTEFLRRPVLLMWCCSVHNGRAEKFITTPGNLCSGRHLYNWVAPCTQSCPVQFLINPRRSKHATWHSYVSRPRHADPIYRRHRLYVNCIQVSVPPRPARGMYLSIYLGTYMMLCRDWLLWPTPPLIHTITHNYYTILTLSCWSGWLTAQSCLRAVVL